ncbi:MAG: DNA primase small subunit PriS [Thermoplasmata archaeon]|nr:DNA primase small subunit PriS [Candidatus Sysuiplasma acidicola]MBX8645168.1 DNA primase small subunit PriS [Candidatus Sysuiplasma acidicola]
MPVEQTPPELVFAKEVFSQYYRNTAIPPMVDLAAREFGFMFFDRGFVHRHVGFANVDELSRYLSTRAPSHAYYSVAYYNDPDAHTMNEKGWLGADLIFDLDADHVTGSEKLPYEKMLARVKEVMIKLYDDFVISDLGFDEDETEIVFSGGRGYHIHVYSENVRKMGSHERREIVDYITASELDMSLLLKTDIVGTDEERRRKITRRRLPSADDGGWYGKTAEALHTLLGEFGDEDHAFSALVSAGIGEKQARRMASKLAAGGRDIMLRTGLADVFDRSGRTDDNAAFMEVLRKRVTETKAGQTDEPVTSDTHRLIRIPGSLHGKTGLKVVSLTRNSLDMFDPLVDALPGLGKEEVTVRSDSDFDATPLGGESVHISSGTNSLPVNLALFLILRRQVRLEPGPVQ